MNLNSVGGADSGLPVHPKGTGQLRGTGEGPRFKDTLNRFVSDVNSMQNEADDSIQRLVSGKTSDVHTVMNTVEEAKIAFNMMMEIRGKVLDAYNELMRMRL
ncbi:flagellar hook-basal body complex protein FliE [Chitinivibrio alkaliphilus]|uniref:Flagellar hook-basal body complex protein FliE n=1 Tax=Chitinivibrio alkaliphilus ACht1 TaxID=1313304 RepID=U7DB89_9BACT|nr:flagellar hook-basal body complex protein FliE [Chitinivibrio alkaliphilus]ERP31690.1 flagellar hook-basal body complex protein FliE [Chitinivibrio alkaliphilus ACht1]